MKKYLMMLFAATAMLATAFTTTSCSKDDDDKVDTYTISASVETGNLPAIVAETLKESVAYDRSIVCTLSEAKSQFSYAVSQSDSGLRDAIASFKKDGATGVSVTIYLKNSKGTVIDKRVWD